MYPTMDDITMDKSVGVTQEPHAHYLLPYFNMGECSDSQSRVSYAHHTLREHAPDPSKCLILHFANNFAQT